MKEEKPLKGKSDPAGAVDNYLFDGSWTEKDGVKWAFFETDKETGETSKESIQQEKIEKGQSLSEKQVISDKISITDLGRASGGQRYSEGSPLPPSGPIKKDTFLSGRYKIQELYKSLEKRDFYLARDIRLDTICIVKELTVDSNDREEVEYYRNRFKEEARILANLNHPNLPVVTDYFIENNRYFMVLDYIKGYDLETLLACSEVSITEEQILLWGIDICEVLEYLHSQKPPVIHRDVSPASLFVRDRDWAIILFNFNFARKQEGKCTAQIGTTGYASPEQMAGKPDIRSDIYSLGATLHRLLTGRTPGKAFDFKPVSVFNPSVSIYADMAVKKALKVNIKERFNNAGEMKEALLEAYDKLGNEEDSWDLPDNEEPFDELSYMLNEKPKRLKAIKALGKLRDPRSLDLLIPFLEDESPGIRLTTISALEELNEKRAVSYLTKLLGDENIEIREKSLDVIAKLTGKKIPPLMIVPKDSDLFSF